MCVSIDDLSLSPIFTVRLSQTCFRISMCFCQQDNTLFDNFIYQRNRVIPLNPNTPVPRNVPAVMATAASLWPARVLNVRPQVSILRVGGLSLQNQRLLCAQGLPGTEKASCRAALSSRLRG